MRNHLALIPTWRYYNLFTIRPEALNQSASWFRLQDPSPLLDYLHQHKCTIESGRGCWRCPQEGSFLDNCTITYPFRRPVFIFVSCSLILPEQHIVISAWRARWIALFLISPTHPPSSAPPYLYRIFYGRTKKRIDSSFNRHLFRLLILLSPHHSQSPFPSNISRTSHHLVLSLPFDLSPPCLVILCFNFLQFKLSRFCQVLWVVLSFKSISY